MGGGQSRDPGKLVVNIGDIMHAAGALPLIEKHFPESEVRLWDSPVGENL